MKFFAKVMAVLVVVSMLSVTAFADDFVLSAGKTDGIEKIEGDVVIVVPDDDSDAIKDLEKEKIEDLVDGFDEKWQKETNAPIENADVTKVFDVDVKDGSETVTVKIENLGDKVVLVAKNKETGAWKTIDFTRDGDKITFTLDGNYTIAVVEDNGNGPVVDNPIDSPQTGVESISVVLAVSTIVLLAGAVVLTKKARNAA